MSTSDSTTSSTLGVQLVCDDVLHWAETYKGPAAMACLTDPPYHLSGGFMGARWDKDGPDAIAFRPETWAALARHLLPGAFVMAFASSRGYHRLACAMEDAGLVLHPSIFNYRTGETLDIGMMGWGFASGFPKATRIDIQVDNARRRDYVLAAQRLGLAIPGRNLDDWTKEDHIPSDAWWERFKGVLSSEQWQAIEREVTGKGSSGKTAIWNEAGTMGDFSLTAPATPLAQAWAGHRYGLQCLKPALEPIIVAQVPYLGRPVDSITQHGAGALNIEGGRIGTGAQLGRYNHVTSLYVDSANGTKSAHPRDVWVDNSGGKRWPANLALCHAPQCQRLGTRQVQGSHDTTGVWNHGYHEGFCVGTHPYGQQPGYTAPDGTETVLAYRCIEGCPVASLDGQAGERSSGGRKGVGNSMGYQGGNGYQIEIPHERDVGPASRFFYTADWSLDVAEQLAQAAPVRYCPKSSRAERDSGLEGMAVQHLPIHNYEGRDLTNPHNLLPGGARARVQRGETARQDHRNPHPTVKPLNLVRWLATLLLPPAAYAPRRLLIPFCGTGSEIIGGILAGFEEVLGIERDPTYVGIARKRIAYWTGYTVPTPVAPEKTPQATPVPLVAGQLNLF